MTSTERFYLSNHSILKVSLFSELWIENGRSTVALIFKYQFHKRSFENTEESNLNLKSNSSDSDFTMPNALDTADDSLNASGKLSVKVSKKIPVEEWNKVVELSESIDWTVPGGEQHKLELSFYPKGDANDETSVSVYLLGVKNHLGTHMSITWTGWFEKPGFSGPHAKITQNKSCMTQEKRPVGELCGEMGQTSWGWGDAFMKVDEVPEHIVNDFLVFHAEIVVFYTSDPRVLFFDEDSEKEDVRRCLLQKIKGTDEDFTIISEGQRMPCHKVLLAAQSEYFETLFGDLKGIEGGKTFHENKSNEVTISDVGADTMNLLLGYLYSLELPASLSRDQTSELLIIADRFQMKHLVKRCVSILMSLLDENTYIQTFLLIEKTSPDCEARTDLFELMKNKKEVVAESEDLPEFVQRYPVLATEFLRAVCKKK